MKKILAVLLIAAVSLTVLLLPASGAEEELRALRAIRISPTQVLVEFSLPLSADGISKPFCALRWMQMKDGKPTALAWSGDIPLQEGRGAHILLPGDASKVILTFDEAKLDAYLDPDHYLVGRGMQAFLGIEEKKPSSGHSHKTLFDVKSQSGKELLSTLPAGGDGWDGVYLPIETDYSYLPVTGEGDAVYLPEIESGEDDIDPAPTPDPKPKGCGGVISPLGLLLALAPVPFALRKRRV